MNAIIPLVLRNMRAPLVALILTYAVSILGLVLAPGPVVEGEELRMDFFHAFYFVSYMATTIGFGEIPFAFSEAQRLWTVISIYLTVVAWVYAIGKILALVQDPAFRHALTEHAFARSIRRLGEPFYIVCGHGDTGSLLVRALGERGKRAVVIDSSPDRISDIHLEAYPTYVPGLCADASLAGPLREAGLDNPHCQGVVAVTGSDAVNLKIAITVKLLNPRLKVSCRADTHDAEANMASFGTDQIINPFDVFADRLALALHSPVTHLLHEWLTAVPNTPLPMPLYPEHGTWLLCGYGRFGKAVRENLAREGVETVIVESDPEGTGCAHECVVGRGTEADTLLAAGIDQAVGVVAGTDDDANNLSIIMTARMLKPDLFTVARQNRRDHDAIFRAAEANLVMQRSETIARRILTLLATPLLTEFLALSRHESSHWANELVSRISAITGEVVPAVWSLTLNETEAPALHHLLARGERLSLGELFRDPRNRAESLPALPLLLVRDTEHFMTPEADQGLVIGDQLLLCGRGGAREHIRWTVENHNLLWYVHTGEERPAGTVWSWLAGRRAAAE